MISQCVTYFKEKQEILGSLKTRAEMVYDRLNKIPGVKCNEVQGAMYAFPCVNIPEAALRDAQVSTGRRCG